MQHLFRFLVGHLPVLVVLFLCTTLPALARVAEEIEAIEQAVSLLERGDGVAARAVLAGARETGRRPGALHLTVEGIIELADQRYDAAEARFRAAIADDPGQAAALWGLSLTLLQRGRAFEAAVMADRAALAAPNNTRITVLQAYIHLALGRATDAVVAGKRAMDQGENSPLLFAVLAQTHRQLGYTQQALAFGSLASKQFFGVDYFTGETRMSLPLTMTVTDTPGVLAPTTPPARPDVQRTDLEIEPPPAPAAPGRMIRFLSPAAGGTLNGVQQIWVAYIGERPPRFLVVTVDNVLRGMTAVPPYRFQWDTDAEVPGEHVLRASAYDQHGLVIAEETMRVFTTAGETPAPSHTPRALRVQQRLIDATMPAPSPRSLFTQLGQWHQDAGEKVQAIIALEKAAAIDPMASGVLPALIRLYRDQDWQPLSATGEITRGPASGGRRVALTFDDGPNPLYTPSILALLRSYNARATFFVVGKMVQRHRDQALQIVVEGHELANHSYTHPNFTRLTREEIITEVLRTRAVIRDVTGQSTHLFRPPGGNINPTVTAELRALNYNVVYWDINAGEYRNDTPQNQATRIAARVKDGSIVLLHTGPVDGTPELLPYLMANLYRRGFTFVTVTELMRR